MDDKAVLASIENLQRLFSIVLALALTEAFKQFVSDKAQREEDESFHWNRLMALSAFLFLLIPFYQGMNQYFFEVYSQGAVPQPYQLHLAIDSLAFTVEASLFFVLSRVLARVHWRRFYWTVFAILIVDSVWATWVFFTHRPQIVEWLMTNAIFGVLLVAILFFFKTQNSKWGPVLAMILLIARGVSDYATSWDFYFPPLPAANAEVEEKDAGGAIVYFAAPLFTHAEWQWNAQLCDALRKDDVQVLLPQERAEPVLGGKEAFDATKLFQSNVADLDRADVVLAILDGADTDSGTAWEVGYAFKRGRPVIGLRSDLRAGGDDPTSSVNLMLSKSCSEIVVIPGSNRSDISLVKTQVAAAIKKAMARVNQEKAAE